MAMKRDTIKKAAIAMLIGLIVIIVLTIVLPGNSVSNLYVIPAGSFHMVP